MPRQRTRPYQASDFMDMLFRCQHCSRMLPVEQANGPYWGYRPDGEWDRYWLLILSDGFGSRFWEHGLGVVVTEKPTQGGVVS